jgi:hypothetical protein
MTHREAVDRFVAEMRSRGVGPWSSAPPLYRLLWLLGAKVPPPHFIPSRTLARLSGALFGLWMLAVLLVVEWRRVHVVTMEETVGALFGACVGGTLFGFWVARTIDRGRRDLKLPSWDEYLAAP